MKQLFSFRALAARTLAPTFFAIVLGGAAARGDVVFAWNEFLLHLVTHSAAPIAPQLEVRVFAMAHLAMDEAVTSASRDAQNADAKLAAQRAAAVSAARVVLLQLLPAETQAINALAERHLAAIAEGQDKVRGIDIGRAAADHILAQRLHDGWVDVAPFDSESGPLPDNSETAASVLARGETLPPSPWLSAAPFVLKSAQQFRVSEVRTVTRFGAIETDPYLQQSRLFKEVDQAGAVAAREGIWSGKPVVAWNRIARQLSATRAVDLTGQARLLATLNVALADATLTTLHWRHAIGSWRSMVGDIWETVDGMPPRFSDLYVQVNGSWESAAQLELRRILLPPTPNYPSVAATLAGAAQTVLTRFFKTDQITFTLPTVAVNATGTPSARTFASISAAARECAYVASLDGHHMREACIAGYELGTEVGNYIGKRTLAIRR
jgi:hypothetical protein